MQKLVDVLKGVGKSTECFKSSDGTRVLILPYGGRVLGLYTPGSEENFYWTHTALESIETAKAFYAGDQWHNSGGDRTWLAPEADVFFPNFPKLDPYFQPRQLDPGSYQIIRSGNAFKLVNKLTITMSRSKKNVDLEITKSIGEAPNPLRHERDVAGIADIAYAGYTQYTSLEIKNADAATTDAIGLWNLVQMPHGGEMLFPTFVRSQPRHIFSTVGTIGSEDMSVTEHLVRYRMRAKGEHKIALRALPSAGRIGYIYQTGAEWAMIVRNFFINPSGEYVDVPWTEPEYFGFSAQACNVNSGLGSFSELEYHIPAIGRGMGHARCDDSSVTWAFRGSYDGISSVCRALLTSEPLTPPDN
jgi:hypothetical protein